MSQTPSTWIQKSSSALDTLISVFSPRLALKREQSRARLELLRAYRGAERSRGREGWVPTSASADAALLPDLKELRDRSRDLNRNDGTANSITNTVNVNVVGSGIRPQSRVDRRGLKIDDLTAAEFEEAAERTWSRWYPIADSQNRMDFYEIQSLVERQILESGEVLVLPLRIENEGRFLPLGLEVIEADRLQTPRDKQGVANIRDGVELGERGQPVAYWINTQHPGDFRFPGPSGEFIRYPAMNPRTGEKLIHHLYWVKRPRQTRGEPFFAPVLNHFKDLADYMEAELMAARIQACFALIFESPDPMGSAIGNSALTDSQGRRLEEIVPGLVHYAAPGEKAEMVNPSRPSAPFEPFVDRVIRFIGAALGLPYELVVKDFSKVNYSSARAALLEARRFFRSRQRWLSSRLNQPVWEWVQREAWLQGHLPGVNLFAQDADLWLRARWIAPGWGWVDPVKEVNASVTAIQNGLSNLATEVAAVHGDDWQEVAHQTKREQAFYEQEQIQGGPWQSQASTPTQDPNSGEPDDQPDDDDIPEGTDPDDLPEGLLSHAKGNGHYAGVLTR